MLTPAGSPRRRAMVLLALSVLLVLAGTVGVLDPLGLVWVERLLDHPFLLGFVAAALFGYGLALLPERVWVGVLLATPCLVVGFGWLAFGFFWSYLFGADMEEVATVSAADGAGRDFEGVMTESGLLDDWWVISIRQTGSPLAREWEVGCVNGDLYTFKGIEWNGRDELVLHTLEGDALVDVDAGNGRPRPVAGAPWETCPWH